MKFLVQKKFKRKFLKINFQKIARIANFLLQKKHNFGIGSNIHVFGESLALGLNLNRTVIYDPTYTTYATSNDQCRGKPGLDCYLLPVTNCTFTPKEMKNSEKFLRSKARWSTMPNFIYPILKQTGTPKSLYRFYWRIQTAFFMVRLNSNFKEFVSNFTKSYLVNPKEKYDVSVLIRQGDKQYEMPLVSPKFYLYPIKIIHRILGRKLNVFIDSDSQNAIDYYLALDQSIFDISYFNFSRSPFGFQIGNKSINTFSQSVLSFASLFESIKGRYLIGTLGSNWNRLVLELRLTYFDAMDLPYFEVGSTRCITPNQCKRLHSKLDFSW